MPRYQNGRGRGTPLRNVSVSIINLVVTKPSFGPHHHTGWRGLLMLLAPRKVSQDLVFTNGYQVRVTVIELLFKLWRPPQPSAACQQTCLETIIPYLIDDTRGFRMHTLKLDLLFPVHHHRSSSRPRPCRCPRLLGGPISSASPTRIGPACPIFQGAPAQHCRSRFWVNPEVVCLNTHGFRPGLNDRLGILTPAAESLISRGLYASPDSLSTYRASNSVGITPAIQKVIQPLFQPLPLRFEDVRY